MPDSCLRSLSQAIASFDHKASEREVREGEEARTSTAVSEAAEIVQEKVAETDSSRKIHGQKEALKGKAVANHQAARFVLEEAESAHHRQQEQRVRAEKDRDVASDEVPIPMSYFFLLRPE